MMDRQDNIPTDDRNIEDLLRPRCEFHASTEMYARIISEAKKKPFRKPWYKKWKVIAASAAAVAVIVWGTAALHHAWSHSSPVLAVTTDPDIPSQVIMETPETPSITEPASSQADDTNEEVRIKKIYRKSAGQRKNLNVNNVISSKNVAATEQSLPTHPGAADGGSLEFAQLPAGPMPLLAEGAKVAEKTTLTTDECDEYVSLLRAAYMNNIERMREEVEETKTFINEMRVSCMQNIK